MLAASVDQLGDLRARAASAGDVLVSDMPRSAQTNRVYSAYLQELAATDTADLELHALSLLGPRNRIDRLTKRLDLLP